MARTIDLAVSACLAVLEWARTPGAHGGNPYLMPHVQAAEIAVAQAEGRAPESWAQRAAAERIEWKRPAEIRRAPERCRVAGCGVPMSPSGAPGTCGNHEIDKPAERPARRSRSGHRCACVGCDSEPRGLCLGRLVE